MLRAFTSFQLQSKAGDQLVNRQQNLTETSTLSHVLTHLSNGLRPELACSNSPPLSKEGATQPWICRGQSFCSFPIQTHQQNPSGFIACPPSLLDSRKGFADPSSQTFHGSPCLQGAIQTPQLDPPSISMIWSLTSIPTAPLCPRNNSQSCGALPMRTAHFNLDLVCQAQFGPCP